MHSICSRSSCAIFRTSAIMPSALPVRVLVSIVSATAGAAPAFPGWTTATLRWAEESSSAKVFICDAPFLLVENVDSDPTQGVKRWLGSSGTRIRIILSKPSLGPFDDRHTFWTQVFLQTRADNLVPRFESVQIEVEQG